MLQQAPFGFDIIKKVVVLFGSTFNDIYINRMNANNVSEIIKVPISYSNKDKMLARVDSDPTLDRKDAALTPRIGFSLTGVSYDSNIKTPSNNYLGRQYGNTILKQYVGVPYSFKFELCIITKNVSDGNRILEQILPFFTPDYTSSVELIPETAIYMNIPITYEGITSEDKYDGQFDARRTIIHTLRFSARCPVFGPIYKPGIIKFIQTTFYDPDSNTSLTWDLASAVGHTPPLERLIEQVTLTANGQPTSNASDSIDYRLINITDDYGFASYIETFSGNTIIGVPIFVVAYYPDMNFATAKHSQYVTLIT